MVSVIISSSTNGLVTDLCGCLESCHQSLVTNYKKLLKWLLPWCAGPLCAGSSYENPCCLALQPGSDVEGLWVLRNTLGDNPQQGCHQVMPQREAVPHNFSTSQSSALHPKWQKKNQWHDKVAIGLVQAVGVSLNSTKT